MKALVLSVGDEIVGGRIADTNAAWISDRLESMGIEVAGHVAVPDDEPALIRELLRVSSEVDLVIASGGIGPTRDDVTRQAIAAAAGVELILDEPTLEIIRERFIRYGFREMPPSNSIQAYIPAGAEILPNSRGTAAGFRIEINGAHVFAMPGVPPEMFAMFDISVAPFIKALSPGRVHVTGTLESFGTSESVIDGKIHDLMAPDANPRVGLLANAGQITVKIVARADDEAAALGMIREMKTEIRRRLGDVIMGEDGEQIQHVVGRLLAENALILATAESCTGGLIAKKITDVPGSSAYFARGYVTYSNEAKADLLGVPEALFDTVGAVSDEVAQAMAEGCLRASGADIAVAVTGIAGPGGGSEDKPVGLVCIGVADKSGSEVHRRTISGDREHVRERTARIALNHVRLRLLGR